MFSQTVQGLRELTTSLPVMRGTMAAVAGYGDDNADTYF